MQHVSEMESVIILVECDSNVPVSDIEAWFQSRGRSTFLTDDVIQAISLAIDYCGEHRPDVILLETRRVHIDFELVTKLSGMFSCGRHVRVSRLPDLNESGGKPSRAPGTKALQWLNVAFG